MISELIGFRKYQIKPLKAVVDDMMSILDEEMESADKKNDMLKK